MTMALESVNASRSDRLFFSGMAIVAAVIVFAAFAPTYYLRSSTLPPLPPLLYVHGLVFTSWILLFITQTALVAAHRTDIHRRLGVMGAVIAGLLVLLGGTVAIDALRRGVGPMFGMEPSSFFSIPIGDVSAFAILVSAAIVLRRHQAAHKRLMLLGTITLLPAAIARLVGPFGGGIISWFILTDLFVVAVVFYDFWSRGRVHTSLVYGSLLVVVIKPLMVIGSSTSIWVSFANALR